MRLTNEICVSFLTGSGWMQNHDKEIIQKTRKEIMTEVEWCAKMPLKINFMRDEKAIDAITEQMLDNLFLQDNRTKGNN